MREERRLAFILPANWAVLDLDPLTRDRSAERMVRQAVGSADSLALYRRWAVKAYRQMAYDASEAGAFFAASYNETVAGRLLSASLIAFVGQGARSDEGQPLGVADMVVGLQAPGEGEETVDPPRRVELRLGPAVRSRVRISTEVPDAGGRRLPVDVTRFFVPVEDTEQLLVVAFSTPMVAVADALAELFDQVALGLSWK